MRGQFFSMDVFIAAIILVSGTIVLLYGVVGTTSVQQAQLFSADVLRESLTTSVRELEHPIVSSAHTGFANRSNPYDIQNSELTLGEVIGEYHHLANASTDPVDIGNYTLRRDVITRETIGSLVPGQYSYSISIGDDISDMTTIVNRSRIPQSNAEYVVYSRSILAGIDRNREFFGPYTLEVSVWN